VARPADTQTVPGRGAAEHLPCFDGLRAIAAIAVVMHHAAIETAFNLHSTLGHYTSRMDAGVQIFFLISGFLLYRPFVAAAFDGRAPMGPRVFFRHRFLRIFPAYIVAYIGISLFIGLNQPVPGARTVVEQLFLVHLYDPTNHGGRALGGISQSWTLVVELSFYLIVPLYAYVMRRVGAGADRDRRFVLELRGLVVLYLIAIAWRAFDIWILAPGPVRNLGQYWLPAQLDLFAMGMFLAVVRTWQQRRDEPVRILEKVGSVDWLWWLCALGVFTIVTYSVGLPNALKTVWGWKAYAKQTLYGLTAFFLLLPAVFGPQDRGPVRRFLQLAPVVYLGTISYGIYLWHQGFIEKIHQWGGWAVESPTNPLYTFRGNYWLHVFGALGLSVVLATLSYYLVERRFLRMKNRPLFGKL